MIQTRPAWHGWTLLALALCACGSGIRPAPTGTTELHGGQPTDVPAQETTLRDALAAMCDEATRLMTQRDRHASQRLGALNLRMMDSEHRGALEEMGRGMASEPHPIAGEVWRFEDMVVQAAQAGEAGFRCAPLERLLELVAAGDEDFEEANAASFEADLRLACQIIAELEARGLHPQEERARFSEYVVVSATNPEFFQMLGSVAATEDKRSVIRAFAEEQGVSEWACLADFVDRVTN